MASGAQMKMVAVGMMMAILFIAAANADGTSCPGPCIVEQLGEVGTGYICSKNCACAGKCILSAGESGEDIKKCFIECVLKNDCYCKSGPADGTPDKKAKGY